MQVGETQVFVRGPLLVLGAGAKPWQRLQAQQLHRARTAAVPLPASWGFVIQRVLGVSAWPGA